MLSFKSIMSYAFLFICIIFEVSAMESKIEGFHVAAISATGTSIIIEAVEVLFPGSMPYFIRIGLPLSIGLTTYWKKDHANQLINSVLSPLTIEEESYKKACTRLDKISPILPQDILNQLLTDGLAFHANLDPIREDFLQALTNLVTIFTRQNSSVNQNHLVNFYKNLNTLYQSFYEKHPLFLLGECDEEDCKFTRSKNSLREEHEGLVSNALITKINTNDKHESIQYTSLGSGYCSPDIIVLTKTLSQKPNASIAIHLIDPDRDVSNYLTAVRNCNLSQQIVESPQILTIMQNIETVMKCIVEKNKGKYIDNHKFAFIMSCFIMENRYRQIQDWLTHNFPRATIQCSIYDSVDNYLAHIKQQKISHPDVLIATDISEDQGNALSSFKKLCDETLKAKKPFITFLAKDDKKIYPLLEQIKTK